MPAPEAARQALRLLLAYRLRALLTLFGLVWGTASVIFLVGWGNAVREKLELGFFKAGRNMGEVWAGKVSEEFTPAVDRRHLWYTLDDVEARPFHDLLADAGVVVAGARQSIAAGAAEAADAALLDVPEGSPVLVCERVTQSAAGTNVLFSEHVYPGHRMSFTVDLAPGARSKPAGLRLVD